MGHLTAWEMIPVLKCHPAGLACLYCLDLLSANIGSMSYLHRALNWLQRQDRLHTWAKKISFEYQMSKFPSYLHSLTNWNMLLNSSSKTPAQMYVSTTFCFGYDNIFLETYYVFRVYSIMQAQQRQKHARLPCYDYNMAVETATACMSILVNRLFLEWLIPTPLGWI